MTKKSLLQLFVGGFFISILHPSCVDDGYDLSKKIDMTISVGGSEFAIPGGMTEEIPLSKILKVEEGDLIKIDPLNGDYFLQQNDVLEKSTVTIDGFTMASPDIDPIAANLRFLNSGGNNTVTVNIPESTATQIALTATLPAEVKSMSYLKADMTLKIRLSMTDSNIRTLLLKEVALVFPEGIASSSLTDGKYIISNKQLLNGSTINLDIPVQGINLSNANFETNAYGELILNYQGNISLEGEVSINTGDILSGSSEGYTNLTVDIAAPYIGIKGMKGVVDPSIEQQKSIIKLSDLPDYLSDKSVRLDPLNPMILVTADNQSPISADISGTFTSIYDNDISDVLVPFALTGIPHNAITNYCMSPFNPNFEQTIWVENTEIPLLIQQIPENIEIVVDVDAAQTESEIDFNAQYSFQCSYEVNVPFVFGDKMNFTYSDSISGWHEDIKKYSVKQINAHGIAVNKIPLNLVFKGMAVREDEQGGVVQLEGVKVYTKIDGKEEGIIKAGELENESQSKVVVEILETTPGAIKNLDGIVWWVEADSKEVVEGRLNENQTFQLKELKLKVPGGMIIDLN